MKLSLTFYYDTGHAWLGVPRKLLKQLGIAEKISEYSYQENKTVYLEEDCDATLFLSAARHKGWKISLDDYYCGGYSFIRDLESYVYD